jgi:tetratricopeptide (TPR) repeat protein
MQAMSDAHGRRFTGQGLVMLLVGSLVGFAAGYFAAGGGRPSPVRASASAPAGDALGEIQHEVDRDPENPELLTALGNAYYDREDWDHAIASYEKARRKAPKNPNLLSDLGAAYRNRGEFELAISYFQKARENDADHWQSLLNWVLVEAFDRKDAAAAQRAFDELKRRYPDVPNLDRIQSQISSLRAAA